MPGALLFCCFPITAFNSRRVNAESSMWNCPLVRIEGLILGGGTGPVFSIAPLLNILLPCGDTHSAEFVFRFLSRNFVFQPRGSPRNKKNPSISSSCPRRWDSLSLRASFLILCVSSCAISSCPCLKASCRDSRRFQVEALIYG